MTETDKLLVRIGTARDAISRKTEQTSLDYMIDGVLMNCSVLLKEQEDHIRNLMLDYEELNKDHERLLDKKIPLITQGEEVIRCKDCKHYDSFSQECMDGIDGIMTPDFYCGNAERKET